jgi:hypothetical protein
VCAAYVSLFVGHKQDWFSLFTMAVHSGFAGNFKIVEILKTNNKLEFLKINKYLTLK